MSRKYYLTEHTSRCGDCNGEVMLLANAQVSHPLFWVCWRCHSIFQVEYGKVGPIEEERADEQTDS